MSMNVTGFQTVRLPTRLRKYKSRRSIGKKDVPIPRGFYSDLFIFRKLILKFSEVP
jgi:hypothetical protein